LTLGQGTAQSRETVHDIDFPKPKEKFGRWLELAIDTGPAIMVNILQDYGQVLHIHLQSIECRRVGNSGAHEAEEWLYC